MPHPGGVGPRLDSGGNPVLLVLRLMLPPEPPPPKGLPLPPEPPCAPLDETCACEQAKTRSEPRLRAKDFKRMEDLMGDLSIDDA